MRHEQKASTPQSMALQQSRNNNNDNNNCSITKTISTNCATINCNNDVISNGLTKEKPNKMIAKTRIIRLYRDGSTQLGFSIRGGWEHGTGIFVSEVHSGSEAAKQGLQAGDQIVRINGFSLEHAIHDEVIALVKSSSKITLKVKSTGMIPVKDQVNDILTWKLLAPSTSPSLSDSPSPAWTSSDSHSDSEHDFLEANIYIDLKGKSLGCSVVKGPLNSPGIYVQSVKCNEIADQSGLQVGDQIIQVNGVNVSQMDFSDAISKLKSLPSMTLTVRKGAGKHLFAICKNARNQFSDNKNIKNGENCIHSKKVTAIVHSNAHSRMLSSSSNCSESSSSSVSKNCNFSDNDFSISEMEASDAGSVQNTNNNFNDSAIRILEKVKQEEERLADERRKLEEEQQKLKLEMEKLEIEKKELERRKQLDECNSLSNCSISSASASSSGSQSISFLEEIKMLGDHGKRNLRPVNITDRTNIKNISKTNDSISNNIKPEDKSKLVNPIKCDNSEKHKQHELLMEEFRRAHRRMFGENDSISQISQTDNKNVVKDSLKESKSLPTNSTTTKTPPAVPIKKSTKSSPQTGPVVSIGTYNNQTFNNRFAPQTHRSVIQVRRDENESYTLNETNNKTNVDKSNTQITIKVISTKQ